MSKEGFFDRKMTRRAVGAALGLSAAIVAEPRARETVEHASIATLSEALDLNQKIEGEPITLLGVIDGAVDIYWATRTDTLNLREEPKLNPGNVVNGKHTAAWLGMGTDTYERVYKHPIRISQAEIVAGENPDLPEDHPERLTSGRWIRVPDAYVIVEDLFNSIDSSTPKEGYVCLSKEAHAAQLIMPVHTASLNMIPVEDPRCPDVSERGIITQIPAEQELRIV